jgi:CelD/BcsL family acetyltransferase involved in cellulose biosynthesis
MTNETSPIIGIDEKKDNCKAAIVRSEEDFFALQDEWEFLRKSLAQSIIFQSWTWNWIWWKRLAPAGSSLCIVTCRDPNGTLIGLAPFYLYTYRMFSRTCITQLRIIGTDPKVLTGEYLDILIQPGNSEDEVALRIAQMVKSAIGCDSFWFAFILPHSAVSSLFMPALEGVAFSRSPSLSFLIDTSGDWKEYVSQRGRKTRKNIRQETRRLIQGQKACFQEISGKAEREAAIGFLANFHRTRWVRKGSLGAFAIPGFESFLKEMVNSFALRGDLRIWAVSHNAMVSGVLIAFIENGHAYAYQLCFDSKYEKDSLGFVLLGLCIRACFESKMIQSLDLLSGGDTFKSLWTKEKQVRFIFLGFKKGLKITLFRRVQGSVAFSKRFLRPLLPVSLILWLKMRLRSFRKSAA